MNFNLSEDILDLKKMVGDFAARKVYPLVAGWDREDKRIPPELFKTMGDMGLLGLTVKEEYGGSDLGYLALSVAIEECCRVSKASISLNMFSGANGAFSAPLIHFGTEEQKKKYLPGVIAGTMQGAMAITEPSGSSSLRNMGTTATPDGDNYIVKGSKVFITRADVADFIITTAESPNGPVALIVDSDTPGLEVAKSDDKMGHHGLGLNPVYYDNCVVPKSQLLGEEGQGNKIAGDSLYEARLFVGAASVGMAQGAIELAVEYSKNRIINGKRVSSFQNTQFVLAEALTKVEAARLLVYRCADALDNGNHEYYMSSMAKYYASEICGEVVDKCLQVFGGYGICKGYDIERIYRDVRVLRILDGTTEIHKRLISKYMGVR